MGNLSFSNGFDGKFDISVTCASGIEHALKSELKRLGYGEVPADNGTFTFSGNDFDVCRLNVNLRTADRVYVKLKSFPAETFDMLFDGVYSIRWEDFFPKDAKIIVDGKCVKSKLFAISASQSIVKKAIVKRLCGKYKLNSLSEDGEEYRIEFSIFKDVASIYINTSGVGLHKRGYRSLVGIAPIKETLASAMLLYSDFYYKNPFLDPFCGSGTIAIEAGNIALNIAPSLRRKFAFNYWQNFRKEAFDKAVEEALDNEKRDRKVEIFGSDIDSKAIKLANFHCEKAGLKDVIKFKTLSVKDFCSDLQNGTIVTNPPYGERVIGKKEAESCYQDFGTMYKKLKGWSAFIITSNNSFERNFGIKADRTKKLYNSEKECKYYYYYGKKEK